MDVMDKTIEKSVIMAIDDDAVILSSISATLKNTYNLRLFTSGKTALEYLSEKTVNLILLDYQMPDMTGMEILQKLQANPKTQEIPIVFLTGSVDSDHEASALELGAADYIKKPIQPRLLHTRVRLQLELQRHRKHLEALVAERTKDLNEAYNKLKVREEITLNMLAMATTMRDYNTGSHLDRTTEFVRLIVEDIYKNPCDGYTLTREEADNIIRSAKLHDLGKISIPDHILLKPGRLTDAEFEVIKTHATAGEQFLSDFARRMEDSFLDTARDITYSHHEKWNGSGYPNGLKGEEIPLSARIVAIADVYDALTTVRPYKQALSHDDSVKIILDHSGIHFDPYITKIFQRHLEDFREISEQFKS